MGASEMLIADSRSSWGADTGRHNFRFLRILPLSLDAILVRERV
jgi:hypothetical protein